SRRRALHRVLQVATRMPRAREVSKKPTPRGRGAAGPKALRFRPIGGLSGTVGIALGRSWSGPERIRWTRACACLRREGDGSGAGSFGGRGGQSAGWRSERQTGSPGRQGRRESIDLQTALTATDRRLLSAPVSTQD